MPYRPFKPRQPTLPPPIVQTILIHYDQVDMLAAGLSLTIDRVLIVPVTALVEPPPGTQPTEEPDE